MVDTGRRFVQSARQRVAISRRRVAAPVPEGVKDDDIRQFIKILELHRSGAGETDSKAGGISPGRWNDVKSAEQGGKLVQRNACARYFG